MHTGKGCLKNSPMYTALCPRKIKITPKNRGEILGERQIRGSLTAV